MHFTDYCGPARYSTLALMQPWLQKQAVEAGLSDLQAKRLQLVLEELFANTVNHGFHGESDSPVAIAFAVAPGMAVLRYSDQAPPFDPAACFAMPRDEEKIGGHGLDLVRALTQKLAYRRENGMNVVEMEFAA